MKKTLKELVKSLDHEISGVRRLLKLMEREKIEGIQLQPLREICQNLISYKEMVIKKFNR